MVRRNRAEGCGSAAAHAAHEADASTCPVPLSWSEARSRLHDVLRQYAGLSSKEHAQAALSRQRHESVEQLRRLHHQRDNTWCERLERCLDAWLAYDLDMLLGFLLSVGLLVLSVVSYLDRKRDGSVEDGWDATSTTGNSRLQPRAELSVYKAQLAASVMFVTGSIFSMLISWRRKVTSQRDSYVGKRRTVLSFLEVMDNWKESEQEHVAEENRPNLSQNDAATDHRDDVVQLSGTSLTDIYSVYRSSNSNAKWHKIPSLLLVEGDLVSLQVGDIAPAKCTEVQCSASTSLHRHENIAAGEKLTVQSLSGGHRGKGGVFSQLPPGRSSLKPENSRELLELCNKTRIFVVLETPLVEVLQKGQGKHKVPQITRKAQSCRRAMQVLSLAAFILTLIILFARPISSDLSLLLPLPFLAALGTLPVFSPAYIFFLETFGIARILSAAHPFASKTSSSGTNDSEGSSSLTSRSLYWRYALNAVFSRLFKNEKTRHIREILTKMILFSCSCGQGTRVAATFVGDMDSEEGLIKIPPAGTYLLEKLGIVTALTIVDDELACEAHSTPQQLLIPSGNGLKLLDLCPNFGDEVEIESLDDSRNVAKNRNRPKSFGDSSHDSDSDQSQEIYQHISTSVPQRTLKKLRRRYKKKATASSSKNYYSRPGRLRCYDAFLEENEVQFEDPNWWQFLPSLKCIGLACALMEYVDWECGDTGRGSNNQSSSSNRSFDAAKGAACLETATGDLVDHVCQMQNRSQLMSLAHCIGFTLSENRSGKKGDLSHFSVIKHLHFVATRLLNDRIALDRHAIGLDESRSWGCLKSDATSIIIQDHRSKAYQLLTVGDARVVAECCSDSWQGENSTISPFSAADRRTILETSTNWSLSDLDVAAFSYTPVPNTLEERTGGTSRLKDKSSLDSEARSYLVDNRGLNELNASGKWLGDWSMVKGQIFLGLLGSAVIPSKEIEPILEACTEAGVRFVYFSPRNMRRTKELASQMGIDVAWNCAISLRPLTEGQEDPHRMTSTYADWDVNAKLPHGVEDVKKHLEEVDNVPLLVSLFTDATKENTAEMIDVFQSYHDTVLAIGLSHLSQNECIFSAADMSIGVDFLSEDFRPDDENHPADEVASDARESSCNHMNYSKNSILPAEAMFVSSIVAHSCILNLRGSAAISHIPDIIASGRAALESTTVAGLFAVTGYVSYAFVVVFCPCSVTTSIPFVPTLGSLLYLQVLIPFLGFSLTATREDKQSMERVPPKNDETVVFSKGEGRRLILHICIRALFPAVAAQIVNLVAFGFLMIAFERDFLLAASCGTLSGSLSWRNVARCDAVRQYSGPAKTWAGSIMLAELALCMITSSASFLSRTELMRKKNPWKANRIWAYSFVVSLALIVPYLAATLSRGVLGALPWYFYVVALLLPLLCLLACELVKRDDQKQEYRAEKLRRLQFETRLGMWSPKESRFLDDTS